MKNWLHGDIIQNLYEVQESYTGGGMGVVYKVYHRNWHMPLAVKSPKEGLFESQVQKDNFIRECETWINLGLHPNIVSCYYVREIDGIPRVFCEFIEGGSLKDWITDKRLYEGSQEEVLARMLDIAIQFAWGLQYAHEANLVHQDVKPANVMLRKDGTPLVTDFGLAKAKGISGQTVQPGNQQSLAVTTGGFTPAYCSPEQFSEQPVTRKTDIWSWAVSILEMFTGEVIWQGGQLAGGSLDVVIREGTQHPEIPVITPELGTLLQKCLQYKAEDRPTGMQEISEELQRIYQSVTGKAYFRKYPQAAEIDAGSLNNRAISYLDLGKEAEAEKLFQEALAKHPGHLDTTYNYGIWKWQNGEIDETSLMKLIFACGKNSILLGRIELFQAHISIALLDISSALEYIEQAHLRGLNNEDYNSTIRYANRLKPNSVSLVNSFIGHKNGKMPVCYSPDGKMVATGGWDSTIEVHEVSTGKCINTYDIYFGYVTSICFSPDGKLLCAGNGEHTSDYKAIYISIYIWDVSSGDRIQILKGHSKNIISLSFTPDGRYIISGSQDKSVKIWDYVTGICRFNYEGFASNFCNVICNSNGKMVLSGFSDNIIKLWEISTGNILRSFQGHTERIESIDISSDGRYLVSGSWETVKLWDVSSGKCIRNFYGHKRIINSVCFSPLGELVLSGSDDQTMKLWELATGRCLRTITFNESICISNEVCSVCFHPDGKTILMGSKSGKIQIWNIDGFNKKNLRSPLYLLSNIKKYESLLVEQNEFKGFCSQIDLALQQNNFQEVLILIREIQSKPEYARNNHVLNIKKQLSNTYNHINVLTAWNNVTLKGHTKGVDYACFSSNGKWILSVGRYVRRPYSKNRDGHLKLWNSTTGECIQTYEPLLGCFSPDGNSLLIGNRSQLNIWKIENYELIQSLDQRFGFANALCFSPDEKYILSRDDYGTMKLWDLQTGTCCCSYENCQREVEKAYFSPNGKWILSKRDEDHFGLWELSTGKCISIFKAGTNGDNFVFSPDGKYLLADDDNNTLGLWDVLTGEKIKSFIGHSDKISSFCFNQNGECIISGSWDKTIRLWDVETSNCRQVFIGHTDSVNSVCFKPDGQWILSGSHDETLKLWNINNKLCSYTFDNLKDYNKNALFSPDGWRILYCSTDSSIKIWELDWEFSY